MLSEWSWESEMSEFVGVAVRGPPSSDVMGGDGFSPY